MIDQIDYTYAARNPWGLVPSECRVLRLYCEHGCVKRIGQAAGISSRTVEHQLSKARTRMNLLGKDIRLYVWWDRWANQFDMAMSQKLLTKEKPNGNKRTRTQGQRDNQAAA